MSEEIYQPTDIVLAKVKGYPPWPAVIIPTEIIPQHILDIRPRQHTPVKAKPKAIENNNNNENNEEQTKTGRRTRASRSTSRRPQYIQYSNTLKFQKFDSAQDHYCVKFLADDSYLWVKANDVNVLGHRDTGKWLKGNGKRQRRLVSAYKMADKVLSSRKIFDVVKFVELGSEEGLFVEEEKEEEDAASSSAKRKQISKTRKREDSKEGTDNKKRRKDGGKEEEEKEKEKEKEEVVGALGSGKRIRLTRSKTTKKTSLEPEQTLDSQGDIAKVETSSVDEIASEPFKRQTRKIVSEAAKSKKPVAKSKGAKPKAEPIPTPVIEKYNYEDDENWAVVGLGPQDFSIDNNISSIVHKLSTKKNIDLHHEKKLDLIDKITSINARIFGLFKGMLSGNGKNGGEEPEEQGLASNKESYELILDEFDSALKVKGAKNEFITVFRSNNELILNFRFLFNAKRHELEDFGLWDAFLDVYEAIYHYRFVPDKDEWDLSTSSGLQDPEEKKEESKDTEGVSQVKSEPS